jgi:hypothetical protein
MKEQIIRSLLIAVARILDSIMKMEVGGDTQEVHSLCGLAWFLQNELEKSDIKVSAPPEIV